jgi:hypothetical protein
LSPSTLNAIAEGGSYDIQVTAPTGCAWAAGSSAAFVSIASGGSGSGNGSFRITVGGNQRDTRQGTVELRYDGGVQTLLVSQAAALLRAIIAAPASCEVNTNCNFDGSASTGVITSYSWDFGDSTKGSGITVTKVYPSGFAGYPDFSTDATVTLTVSGPSGSASSTAVVNVFFDFGSLGLGVKPPARPGSR